MDPPTCGACYLESFASQISVLSGNTACASKILEPSFFHECPSYLPICGIYLPFQVNLHVPNSKSSNNNLFCMPKSLMKRQGAVSVFHARWVILTMSVYSLVIHKKVAGNWDAQFHARNQIKKYNHKTKLPQD